MSDLTREAIECRTFLWGVLPSLIGLARLSPEAQRLVAQMDGQLRIRRWHGPWVALGFEKGCIRRLREEELRYPLDVLFLTDPQVNRFFRGCGWTFPLITGGFGNLMLLKSLRPLVGLLKQHLRGPDAGNNDPELWRIHAQLLLGVVLRSVKEIGMEDPEARMILDQTPGGLIELRIGALPGYSWICWQKDCRLIETGEAPAPSSPDVVITFRDQWIAAAALRPGFDAAAAVGRGDVAVQGLLPLAEGLGLVMERVPLYLETP
jgi:hypothetical protein